MTILHRATLSIFADYHQFHVQDGGIDPDAPADWTAEDVAKRAKVAPNIVVVCPLRNMTVDVDLEIRSTEPKLSLDSYDHVVQCSLELETGYLQVHECTGGELLHLSVAPGTYTVLLLFSQLASIDEHGLEGDDRYRVILWPSQRIDLNVLKAWHDAE